MKPVARIWIAIPSGNFTRDDIPDIAKALIRRARMYLKANGLRRFCAKTLDDYGDQLLNGLYRKVIPEMMHEFYGGTPGNSSFRMEFDRRPEKETEDELFIGRDEFRNLEG